MNLFFIGIIILFFSGIVALFSTEKIKTQIITFFTGIASILCLIPATKVLIEKTKLIHSFEFNSIYGLVNFEINAISAFFILIITIMSFFSVLYANGYLKPYKEKGKNLSSHLIFLPILIASMLLVVTVENALMFLICWEIMSLSSFFLVIFESEKKETRKAGIKYLVFMHISVLFIIIAFALCSISAQSFNFSDFSKILQAKSYFTDIIFLLALIGFGTKAGFVPFHNWLPDAHPAAPSHVSAIMSGVMIKMGIYGIIKMIYLIGEPSKIIAYTVLIISIITALYGVLYTVSQHDIKRLLAYCSIENIGIIGLGLGIGLIGLVYSNQIVATLGFAGGLLHILNHSIFKEILFLSAGNVYTKTHTKNIEILGGLIKPMPITACMFLIGAIAICGLPPLNGFISEFLIYFGTLKALEINDFFAIITLIFSIAGLALVGTMAILAFTKAFSIIFLGLPRNQNIQETATECEKSMIFPLIFLTLLAFCIGLFPQHAYNLITTPLSLIVNTPELNLQPIEVLSQISIFVLSFIVIVFALVLLKTKIGGKIDLHETWGCGYDKPNSHMQYSALSYASPFLVMLKPLFKRIYDIEKPKKLFPKSAHFNVQIDDIEEAYLINPIVKFDEWFLSKFEKMQSGNIQDYIKYGLIFLAILIIGCFLTTK